jgi:Lar family restriction alleviation protein
MSAPELKPCPFCGGEATVRDDPHHRTAVYIGCETVGCFGHYQWDETQAEAITAWNTRAQPSHYAAIATYVARHDSGTHTAGDMQPLRQIVKGLSND